MPTCDLHDEYLNDSAHLLAPKVGDYVNYMTRQSENQTVVVCQEFSDLLTFLKRRLRAVPRFSVHVLGCLKMVLGFGHFKHRYMAITRRRSKLSLSFISAGAIFIYAAVQSHQSTHRQNEKQPGIALVFQILRRRKT